MPRRKRRDKGAGSVYRAAGRGWCAQRELPPGPDGQRRTQRRYFAEQAAAQAQVSDWHKEAARLARHAHAGATVQQWIDVWLAAKSDAVSPRTMEFYERHLAYTLPRLGAIRLIDLTPQHIREMLATLAEQLSAQSRAHIRKVLRACLQLAVKDEILTRNPVDTVEAPKVARYEAHALSDAECAAFLAAADTDNLRALWHLFLDFGPRFDELLTTHYADWDQTKQTLRIRATKNDRQRYLPLTDAHMVLLAEHWERVQLQRTDNAKWKERGYLFPSDVGTKKLQSNVRRRFKQLLKLAGLPTSIRVHDLRHTAATNLIAAGNDIPTVQYITGHKDTGVLLEIYAHAQSDRNREAVKRVEAKRRRQG